MIATLIAGLARLLAGGHVRWLEQPQVETQRVYIANHTSHLDSVLLWSSLPRALRRRARPVAARDYWAADPLRRYLSVRVFRSVLIDRVGSEAHAAVSQMVAGLGDKDSLILFPEGTRGSGERVAPFKTGVYHLCEACPGLELVPVYIENPHRILPKGEFLPVPMLTRITFGVPLRLREGESKQEFLVRAHDAVTALREA
jgi:1-acyl-sn-glycerol-3-phosphate acyltransferase